MELLDIDQLAVENDPLLSPRNHQLWVNLSSIGTENVFAALPGLLQSYMEDMDDSFCDIILPSNHEWQTKVYYKLVEKQRMFDPSAPMIVETPSPQEDPGQSLENFSASKKKQDPQCQPEYFVAGKKSRNRKIAPVTWTVSDIAKAGCILSHPPQNVTFEDEQEMRRVYTLIYDVFRYKNILMQALNDVLFFQIFPNLEKSPAHVWLLFYDLYHRHFKKRETSVGALASKLFDQVGLAFPENALWTQKVKLAAAVSRLRIQHNALSLSELLPNHLQDEKVTEQAKNNPVSCWVNALKIEDIKDLSFQIEREFQLRMVTSLDKLDANTFKWDPHCPHIISFHASMRRNLARSQFVKNHLLIVQDKSFCRGAATFGKVVKELGLAGSVIQTHIYSPRTTAYLAMLLTANKRINKLLAFSAGKRKSDYESYFLELGFRNVTIYADRLIDLPADSSFMEEVVAIYATPPNSYSAVSDPIDLVCSRGGDLSMLEVLTQCDESAAAKERVVKILDEQKKTLSFSMSRPQIQFVLYETHSGLEAENDDMVTKTLRDMNKLARLQHLALQGSVISGTKQSTVAEETISVEIKEINNNEKKDLPPEGERGGDDLPKLGYDQAVDPNKIASDIKEKYVEAVQLPNTDLFELQDLPSLCANETSCINLRKEGCYLALIQRKEVIRIDDKFMIQMAENRGLFGSNADQSTVKSKTSRTRKQEKPKKKPKSRKRLHEIEIDRIAAPTHTFLCHTKKVADVELCTRCQQAELNDRIPQSIYKRWWFETTRHILDLKKCLSHQKVIPTAKTKPINYKNIVDNFLTKTPNNIDDIAAKSNAATKYPIFPKLRLTRDVKFVKIQMVDDSSQTSEIIQKEVNFEQEENENLKKSSTRMSTFSLLGKLNSAQIRQFVSPDFKDASLNFMTPKSPKTTQTTLEKFRRASKKVQNKFSSLKRSRPADLTSRTYASTSDSNRNKIFKSSSSSCDDCNM